LKKSIAASVLSFPRIENPSVFQAFGTWRINGLSIFTGPFEHSRASLDILLSS